MHTITHQYLLGTLWGWLMGPHSGLSLWAELVTLPRIGTGTGTTGKLLGSACYDKQQVCVYMQPFSR